MRYDLRTVLLAAVLAAGGCQKPDDPPGDTVRWELKPPAPDAEPVWAYEKMPGIYPAGSRTQDRLAPGGFGPCSNFPKTLAGRDWGTNREVAIVAFPDEPAAYIKHRGFALRVVNRTSETRTFMACDSVLSIVREAQDTGGAWREIESRVEPICGNSCHRVFLGPAQYWEFPARQYGGRTKTKMRFRLDPGGGQPALYSNEFDGPINNAQFQNE